MKLNRKIGKVLFCFLFLLTINAHALDGKVFNSKDLVILTNSYLQSKGGDDAWLIKNISPTDDFADVAMRAMDFEEQAKKALEQLRATTTLSSKVVESFKKIKIGVLTSKDGKLIIIDDQDSTKIPHDLLLCLIPKNLADDSYLSLASFDRDAKAIMIFALHYPEKLLPALIFHEMGHAYYLKLGKQSPGIESFSKKYCEEEVEMLDLGRAIVDKSTGGAFFRFTDELLRKVGKAKEPKDVLAHIELQDLIEFDGILEAKKCKSIISGLLVFEYIYNIGARYIENNFKKERDRKSKKEEFCYFLMKEYYKE
jgi:hypothetical protein